MPKNIYEPVQDDGQSILDGMIAAAGLSDIIDMGAIDMVAKRIFDDLKSDGNIDWSQVPYYQELVIKQNARLLGVVEELSNHISELPDCVASLRVLSDVANSITKNLGGLVKNLPQKTSTIVSRQSLLDQYRKANGDDDEEND